ncbi:MAG: M24 family metallopeptidase [Eubacteriaceae bacterium]
MNKQRMNHVILKMKEIGLEQILVTSTASVFYLTGYWIEPHERMMALYLHVSGEAVLFGNEIFGLQSSKGLPFISHKDSDNPVEGLGKILRSGKIGIDKFWYSKFTIDLMVLRKDIIPVHGSDPIDQVRKIKDLSEIEILEKNSRINDWVITEMIGRLEEGIQENVLASQVNQLFLKNGADSEGVQLVCFGANGADPHHVGDQTTLKPGDSVIFDLFTPINHYWCDMTRTVFYQKVSQKQEQVYNTVLKANLAAIDKVKPGVLLSEIDKAAREVIEKEGYGDYFTHRTGHGIGIDCHEPPDVSHVSQTRLEPGMFFSIEPGIYLPREFGVRIEDLVMVTETGVKVLNQASKELQVVK